jgi:hypothetical protein
MERQQQENNINRSLSLVIEQENSGAASSVQAVVPQAPFRIISQPSPAIVNPLPPLQPLPAVINNELLPAGVSQALQEMVAVQQSRALPGDAHLLNQTLRQMQSHLGDVNQRLGTTMSLIDSFNSPNVQVSQDIAPLQIQANVLNSQHQHLGLDVNALNQEAASRVRAYIHRTTHNNLPNNSRPPLAQWVSANDQLRLVSQEQLQGFTASVRVNQNAIQNNIQASAEIVASAERANRWLGPFFGTISSVVGFFQNSLVAATVGAVALGAGSSLFSLYLQQRSVAQPPVTVNINNIPNSTQPINAGTTSVSSRVAPGDIFPTTYTAPSNSAPNSWVEPRVPFGPPGTHVQHN